MNAGRIGGLRRQGNPASLTTMSDSHPAVGRFLPSRVFSRWSLIVRLGGLVAPLLVLGWCGFVLYITPRSYQSAAVFELAERSGEETAALVRSQKTILQASEALDLPRRLGLDRDAIVELIQHATVARVLGGRVVELQVRLNNAEDARDIAMELPKALRDRLGELHHNVEKRRLDSLDALCREAADLATEKAQALRTISDTTGEQPADPADRWKLALARSESGQADAAVARLHDRCTRAHEELRMVSEPMIIHAEPVLAASPVAPDNAAELGAIGWRAVWTGLALGIVLPYLLELCVPPRAKSRKPVRPPAEALAASPFDPRSET